MYLTAKLLIVTASYNEHDNEVWLARVIDQTPSDTKNRHAILQAEDDFPENDCMCLYVLMRRVGGAGFI